jgi:hypothetical protein
MSGSPSGTAAEEISQLRAPEEFRRAIVRDPFNSTFRYDFDAARGATPIPDSALIQGGAAVPRTGFYFDLDGPIVKYYRVGVEFPKFSPTQQPGGRFFFLTDRLDATTSDLKYMVLRAGWDGDVREIIVL